MTKKREHIRFTPEIRQKVKVLLIEAYSLEQVVGTLKTKGIDTVSIERIHQHIGLIRKLMVLYLFILENEEENI